MDRERWARIQELFGAALALPEAERAAYLNGNEADPEIRADVARLLEADTDPATILAGSASDLIEGVASAPADSRARAAVAADATAASRDQASHGTPIGPYRLLERVGDGGMGAVHLAEHVELGQRVAVKLIKRGMDTEEIIRRFETERQILARLEHPNIARLLDGGVTDDGLPWFSMEYVDGEPIDAYCDGRGLPIHDRLELFEAVCEAVQYAHSNLVVHRDLKPSNILVSRDGTVKLLDFGIAKVVEGDERDARRTALTRTGVRPMTPGYAAPEQVRGEAVTTATDVYALGVLLYRLIAGERPYGEDLSIAELEEAILAATPSRPSTRSGRARGKLTRDLDNIALMALRKEPERRYGSAGALAADVRSYRSGHPVQATRDSVVYRMGKFIGRNRAGVATAAAMLAVLVGTITWYTHRLQVERDAARYEAQKSAAVANFLRLTLTETTPEAKGGVEATARDLLEWASENAEAQLGEYPEALATTLNDLGRVYRVRGDGESAEPLMERGLAVKREMLGDRVDDELVQFVSGLGTIRAAMGRYEDAEASFREALDLSRQYPAYNGYAVAFTLNNLAKHLTRMGRYAEAEPLLAEAVEVYIELLGSEHYYTAIAMANHARARWHMGALDGLDSVFAHTRRVKPLGEDHNSPSLAEDYYSVAELHALRGDFELARVFSDSAIAHWDRLLRDDRSLLAVGLQQRAMIDLEEGAYATALTEVQDAEELFRAEAAADDPRLGEVVMRVGIALREIGRIAEAEVRLLEAVEAADAYLPVGHPGAADPRFELGVLYAGEGRWEEAERWLSEALAIRESGLPDGHWLTARARVAYGESLAKRGAPGDAAPLVRQAVQSLRALLGDDHRFTAEAGRVLAELN